MQKHIIILSIISLMVVTLTASVAGDRVKIISPAKMSFAQAQAPANHHKKSAVFNCGRSEKNTAPLKARTHFLSFPHLAIIPAAPGLVLFTASPKHGSTFFYQQVALPRPHTGIWQPPRLICSSVPA